MIGDIVGRSGGCCFIEGAVLPAPRKIADCGSSLREKIPTGNLQEVQPASLLKVKLLHHWNLPSCKAFHQAIMRCDEITTDSPILRPSVIP